MRVALHEDRLVATLEEVADGPVTPVERLRIDAVQVPHRPAEPGVGRLDEQVVVVAHQTEAVQDEAEAISAPLECPEEPLAVGVVLEDGALRVAATGDVVGSAGELDSQRPRHRASLPEPLCSYARLDPDLGRSRQPRSGDAD